MDLKERIQRRRQAQEAFTRAASAALELDEGPLTSALLFAAMGLMHLVASDPDERLLENAMRVMARYRGEDLQRAGRRPSRERAEREGEKE